MAETTAIFEPFRNPVTVGEVISCMSKLWDLRGELERQARRENTRYDDAKLPTLWILTPTASKAMLEGFGAIPKPEHWMEGIYFLPRHLKSAIVVIHQLPETPETMWLRILGKGKVQQRAIGELSSLATDDPLRIIALELLYQLQSNLVTDTQQELQPEERELIMAIPSLFREQLEAAQQQGIERGIEQGIEQGIERGLEQGRQAQQRLILENFLQVRLGEINSKMTAFLSPISKLPAAEFTVLLLAISMLTVDEAGKQQAVRLLAENVLRIRQNELGDILPTALTNLLAMPVEQLTLFVEQLPQLSADELRTRLAI